MIEILLPSVEQTTVTLHVEDKELQLDLGDLALMIDEAWEAKNTANEPSMTTPFITLFSNAYGSRLTVAQAIILIETVTTRMNDFKKKSLILQPSSEETQSK